MRKLGDRITFDFTTHNPITGQITDADVIPTCEVFEDDTDIPILTPTVVKRVAKTGNYRLTFLSSAANGFELGKSYNVIVSATVAGTTAKARVGSFAIEEFMAASPASFRT
jgi:hypothetical protein